MTEAANTTSSLALAAANDESVDLFDDFAVNNDAVWVPYRGNVEFLIARTNNPAYKRRASYYYKKNQRLIDAGGPAGDAKNKEMMRQLMAETILLGWKGDFKIQGAPAGDYSVDKANQMLELELFQDWVATQAADTQAYKVVKAAEDLGN